MYIYCDTAAKCWRRRNSVSLVPAATAATFSRITLVDDGIDVGKNPAYIGNIIIVVIIQAKQALQFQILCTRNTCNYACDYDI